MKKYLYKLFLLLLVVGVFAAGYFATNTEKVFAYGNGVYTNILGSGYVSCTDNCNNLYIGEAECNPDNGTCTGKDTSGGNNWWVYKFICDGKHNECGGNGPVSTNWSKVKGQSVKIDQGVACGQTVQLDVFTKDCNEGGWSCGGNDLKGYMVWYSGDCTAPTNPPAACNADCSSNPNICQQATDGCTVCNSTSKKCEPPSGPACNADCSSNPNICQQATDGCTVCNATTKKCSPPSPSGPSGPPGPACNTSCAGNANICLQATDGCTVCNGNTKTCQPPSNPSITPIACNTSCAGNPSICLQAGNGCTVCNPSTQRCEVPSGTPSVTLPPPPTVTPDFDPAMCKCDQMTSTPLIAGQEVTFTAWGKVEGQDISKARITGMTFLLGAADKGSTTPTTIGQSQGPVAAKIVEESPNKVRYQSDWKFKLPANVDPNKSYRAFANIVCEKKTQANAGTQSVLAVGDENVTPSFFGQIINFFKGIFGIEEETATVQMTDEANVQQEQIRLGTVRPANVTLKACNGIYFEFPSLKTE